MGRGWMSEGWMGRGWISHRVTVNDLLTYSFNPLPFTLNSSPCLLYLRIQLAHPSTRPPIHASTPLPFEFYFASGKNYYLNPDNENLKLAQVQKWSFALEKPPDLELDLG